MSDAAELHAPSPVLTGRTKPINQPPGGKAYGGALNLSWLPVAENWNPRVKQLDHQTDWAAAWRELVALANTQMDFVRTVRLDRSLQRLFAANPPTNLATKPVRLALLGSSTLTHLTPGLRVAALRRGIWLSTYECGYGQYLQELSDAGSSLHAFKPNAVLFTFDAHHLMRGIDASLTEAQAEAAISQILAQMRECWRLAQDAFRCPILQQTVLPVFPTLLGNNEHRLPGSRSRAIAALNSALRGLAQTNAVDLLAIDTRIAQDGLAYWHDHALWHRAKQEISPVATALYGDLVMRLLAARQGRSYKCLVLDLDNTLWGGVIGDDGLEGIVCGQGSAAGEAFVAFQSYARELAKRGVILAVCSKNDEANAFAPFDQHPEMLLKRTDISFFVANWQDKASNIRAIAQRLNIGIDTLVFVDDNPFERNLIGRSCQWLRCRSWERTRRFSQHASLTQDISKRLRLLTRIASALNYTKLMPRAMHCRRKRPI